MKRAFAVLSATIALTAILAGCKATPVDNVGELGEELTAALQELGISEEDFAAMSEEQQQALLAELGMDVAPTDTKTTKKTSASSKKTTLTDVGNGGDYVVTVSDGMMWNYFELHYKDGKLVKIVTSFQKNDEEEPEVETVTGNAIADYHLFDLDYTVSPSALVSELNSLGYTEVYIEKA